MILPCVFDDVTDEPCPVCLALAKKGAIQSRGVLPLPRCPARTLDNQPCCRDCESTENSMKLLKGQHSIFAAARLTVCNERLEGLAMPSGMMEHFGMCALGIVRPCSINDLEEHSAWLTRHGIPDSNNCDPF